MSSPFNYLGRRAQPAFIASKPNDNAMSFKIQPTTIAVDAKSAPSAPEIHNPDVLNNIYFPNSPQKNGNASVQNNALESNVNTSKAHGKQDRESSGCYYNNNLYACGCTTAGGGPRIIHLNCYGVPLGNILCDNMRLNRKYPEIDRKCGNCTRDDVLVKDAMNKNKLDNSVMNQAQGWVGEQTWEDVSYEFVTSHSPIVKKHQKHSQKVRKGEEPENPDYSWSPTTLQYNHTTIAQKQQDVTAAQAIFKISETPVDLHAFNSFDPAINWLAAATSKGSKLPMKLSSTRQQNARPEHSSVSYLKPAVSPHSAFGQNVAAAEDNMNTSYKAKLLEKAAMVKVKLENYGFQLDGARSENNPSQLKLLQLVVDELKQLQESLEAKIALTEKPRLAWNTQEKIINSSEPARVLMQKEAEKEASEAWLLTSKDPVSFLPRLKRSGGSSNLVAQARPKIAKKTTNTTSGGTRVEHVMKEAHEYGWDMLDEFEDLDWVDLPSP